MRCKERICDQHRNDDLQSTLRDRECSHRPRAKPARSLSTVKRYSTQRGTRSPRGQCNTRRRSPPQSLRSPSDQCNNRSRYSSKARLAIGIQHYAKERYPKPHAPNATEVPQRDPESPHNPRPERPKNPKRHPCPNAARRIRCRKNKVDATLALLGVLDPIPLFLSRERHRHGCGAPVACR